MIDDIDINDFIEYKDDPRKCVVDGDYPEFMKSETGKLYWVETQELVKFDKDGLIKVGKFIEEEDETKYIHFNSNNHGKLDDGWEWLYVEVSDFDHIWDWYDPNKVVHLKNL